MAASRTLQVVYVISFGLHVVGAILLNQLHAPPPQEIVTVQMQTIEAPEKQKPPEPEPEAPPVPKAPPRRSAAPPPPVAAPVAAAAPDFGFVMGSGGGPGGIAIPTGPVTPPPPKPTAHKVLAAPPPPSDSCEEALVKPKALSMPHPSYTDAGKAAGIEGKVRVELKIDAQGQVTSAKVLEGLGMGLDEAAIASLQGATFSPATKCGKATATTFVVAVRFAL
jgi:protein TonB